MIEYHVEQTHGLYIGIGRLTELGAEGWLLIQSDRDVAYFMRAKEEPKPKTTRKRTVKK